ncbi:hypothetical protein Droror1_Dr00012958 [Drosera rotundifolia]
MRTGLKSAKPQENAGTFANITSESLHHSSLPGLSVSLSRFLIPLERPPTKSSKHRAEEKVVEGDHGAGAGGVTARVDLWIWFEFEFGFECCGFAGCSIASFGLVGLSKRGIWLIEGAATIKELMVVELWSGGAEELGPVEWLGKTVKVS